ncbi:MAG: DUF211 domain-containing protein [Archaeoglobaceae archaeon]
MPGIRRLVLDVLKPHEPPITVFAVRISNLEGVTAVNITLQEVDQATESVKITIVGDEIDYELVSKTIEELGGVVHSIDEVVAGKIIIDAVKTEQD